MKNDFVGNGQRATGNSQQATGNMQHPRESASHTSLLLAGRPQVTSRCEHHCEKVVEPYLKHRGPNNQHLNAAMGSKNDDVLKSCINVKN